MVIIGTIAGASIIVTYLYSEAGQKAIADTKAVIEHWMGQIEIGTYGATYDQSMPNIIRPARPSGGNCQCKCRAGGEIPNNVPQIRAWRYAISTMSTCPAAAIDSCARAIDRIPETFASIHHVQASCSDGSNRSRTGGIAQ